MSVETFFRLAVWLPIILPLAVSAAFLLSGAIGYEPFGSVLPRVKGTLGLVAGYGLPYLVYALWLSRRPRGIPEARLWRDLRRGPFVFSIACTAVWLAVLSLTVPFGVAPADEIFPVLVPRGLIFLAAALGIGYAYAILIFAVFWALRGLGILPPRADTRALPLGDADSGGARLLRRSGQ